MKIGNQMGYFGLQVPPDRWVVVEDDDYSNGGHGPSTIDGVSYKKLLRAARAAKSYRKQGRKAYVLYNPDPA